MKKIFLLLGTSVLLLHADLSVEQIQEMVLKIHEKREGVKLETLDTTPEPFVRVVEENNSVSRVVIPVISKEKVKLDLHAIVNGKAYINDAWLDVNDTVLGYTLKFIGKRGVVLRNENHIKKLFLHKKKNSFITFKEGRR